jgi:hypothetical protein
MRGGGAVGAAGFAGAAATGAAGCAGGAAAGAVSSTATSAPALAGGAAARSGAVGATGATAAGTVGFAGEIAGAAGGRITEGAGRVVGGVMNLGADGGGAADLAAGALGAATLAAGAAGFPSTAGGRTAAERTGATGAAACCFCAINFRTSPGLEMWERSILGLISSGSRVDRPERAGPADSAEARKWTRTFSASWSSRELECVFFSVTPTAPRTSRIALLLTSSSLARSLIRILLIRPFLAPPPLL